MARVQPHGAENPRTLLFFYPRSLCAQKIRAILPTASQSCAVLWRRSVSYSHLCTYSTLSSPAAGTCFPWRNTPPPSPGAPARPAWRSWLRPGPTEGWSTKCSLHTISLDPCIFFPTALSCRYFQCVCSLHTCAAVLRNSSTRRRRSIIGSSIFAFSVSDPDWIRIQSDQWIHIRIQEGKSYQQK